jgi:hypothetical protein
MSQVCEKYRHLEVAVQRLNYSCLGHYIKSASTNLTFASI